MLRTPRGWGVLAIALMVSTAAAVVPAAGASGPSPPQRVRIGHVPRIAASAKVIGALAGGTPIHITVALKPRDPAGLTSFAEAVSTPGSSLYHAYLTRAQFAQRFGQSAGQLSAVESSLRAHGLSPGAVSANRLSISVTATAAKIEHAFTLSLRRTALAGGRQAVVASAAPALDARVAGYVQAVLGLTSLAPPHPQSSRPSVLHPASRGALGARATSHVATGGPQACAAASSAASSQGAYTADQIASAYSFSSLYGIGAQGQGQTIGIYELEPNDPNDIAAYQSCYGTSASVSYVQVDGGAGSGPGSGEAALDIENAIGLAPKANFIVYQAPNASQDTPGSGPYDAFSTIVSQDRAQVVSVSWGQCEQLQGSTNARSESVLFQEAAAQGQSIVAATGDQGSEDCNGANNQLPDPSLAVDDPASQPFVTGVGGTTLKSPGPAPSETVWNNGGAPISLLPLQGGAAGGGVSQLWPMPSYQSGASGSLHVIQPPNSSGSSCGASGGYCRQVPDVSVNADPNTGYIIYWNGSSGDLTSPSGWQAVGGTSAAAPLWAALLADSNSACHAAAVGFANPALYRAAGSAYASDFNDITVGNNDLIGTNGGLYPAGAAYDMASGLGTPNAGALASGLCANTVLVNNPGTQVSTVGRSVNLQIRTTAPAGAKLTYSAAGLPTGLSISRATGRITGRPRKAGTWTVSVGAVEPSLGLRGASFTWRVAGAPTVSQSSLAGIGTGHPKLALTVTAGRYAPALKGVSIGLPAGLSFGRLSRNVSVAGAGGKRIGFTPRLVAGRLVITLAASAQRIRITVGGAAIRVTAGLAANARGHRVGALGVTVETTDAGHRSTALRTRIKPRG